MKNIIWLASYPKSGNTWLRAFIGALLGRELISARGEFSQFSNQCNARDMFAQLFAGEQVPPTDSTNAWRRPYQAKLSARAGQAMMFCKTHCRYRDADDELLFEPDVGARAVLIVRNPIDVCASLTNHFGVGAKVAVDMITNPKAAMARNSPRNFETPLGDWTAFNKSWLAQRDMPLTLIRYEDLFARPEQVFGDFARDVLGISDPARIASAIAAANFDELQGREQRFGFNEKPGRAERFFWKGRPWHGLDMLDRAEQRTVWARHRHLAEALGYHYADGSIALEPLKSGLLPA